MVACLECFAAGSASVIIAGRSVPAASIRRVGAEAATEGVARSFEVSLSPPPDDYVVVGFEVDAAGTDAETDDYVLPPSESVVFEPGQTMRETFTVKIDDDSLHEPDEQLTLKLTDGDHYTVNPAQDSAVVVITDDDSTEKQTASIALAAPMVTSIAEDAAMPLKFRVSLPEKAGRATKVYYGVDTASGAKLGEDFTLSGPAGYVVVPEDELSADITLTVVNDGTDEPVEDVTLYLFDTPNINIGTTSLEAAADILADASDNPPTASLAWADGFAGSMAEGDSYRFTISLSGVSGHTLQVGYDLGMVASPAVGAKADDVSLALFPSGELLTMPGVVVFEPGETAKTVVVTAVADGKHEPVETLKLALGDSDGNTSRYQATAQMLTATISSADAAPTVTVSFDGMAESRRTRRVAEGSAAFRVKFVLSAQSGHNIEVVPGMLGTTSADVGVDYTFSSGLAGNSDRVVFEADTEDLVRYMDFTALAENPPVYDPGELVAFDLPGDDFYSTVSGRRSLEVTITDTTGPPVASLHVKSDSAARSAQVTEGSSVTLQVKLSVASAAAVDVHLATAAAAADAVNLTSGDFSLGLTNGVVPVAAGRKTADVTFTAEDDDLPDEGTERLRVYITDGADNTDVSDDYTPSSTMSSGEGSLNVDILNRVPPHGDA